MRVGWGRYPRLEGPPVSILGQWKKNVIRFKAELAKDRVGEGGLSVPDQL